MAEAGGKTTVHNGKWSHNCGFYAVCCSQVTRGHVFPQVDLKKKNLEINTRKKMSQEAKMHKQSRLLKMVT